MDGYLSNKPDNFVDDPEKLYRLRRHEAHQAKKLDFIDSKSEDKGSKESPKNSPPQSPRENRLPPMGDQLQERKIGELCTPNIIDLPILNLEEIGRPFEIKTSTICMVQHSPFTSKEDFLHFFLFRLFLLPWFFLINVTMRWNKFNFNHIAYLKAWSKLERTPLAVNFELDLPLPTSMVAPTVLRKGLPRMSGGFSLSPISSTTKSTGMKWCPTFTGTSLAMPKG
jgi:hypothetical protein